MKKIQKSVILAICAICMLGFNLRADEGMWLLPLLERFNIKTMNDMGCRLTAEQIYSINNSSLKDAIVHFGGGCTGEIISDRGLLVTNHHCGYGSIQKLSSVEHNYLADGYWAMSLDQELPAKGLTVTFIDSFTDVTDLVNEACDSAIKAYAKKSKKSKKGEVKSEEQIRSEVIEALESKLRDEARAKDKYLNAGITSFYNRNVYYFICTKTFKDIRFVGAPPSSIGKFGADTDNWTWPRHTGDFSMFRVYADKNNNPADYSQENVPYTPKRSLAISLKGAQKDDFTMIIGFPGRTTRFMTSEEAKETQFVTNAASIKVRGIAQEIMMADMESDPKIRIQYSSKYAGSSNGWKKWIGMAETFNKLNVIGRRAAEEQEFVKWANETPERAAKYGKAIDKINTSVAARAEYMKPNRYLSEVMSKIEIISPASVYMQKRGNTKERLEAFYKDFNLPTAKKVTKAMLEVYREDVSSRYMPDIYANVIDKEFGGDIAKYVENLYSVSAFRSMESFLEADSKGEITNDPVFDLLKSFAVVSTSLRNELSKYTKDIEDGKHEYLAGVLEKNGDKAIYPDANSTMRITYGKVLPYSPRDAVEYDYVTTLDGVMQKEDPDNWEFVVPAKLKGLWKAKDFGRYAMADGRMPVAFLSNNDITGGNSGSPILNANGELLGLAFDGNWESMSSDVIFEPDLQRCINVDIRYVLFIVDKFGGAGYLLNEMKIVE